MFLRRFKGTGYVFAHLAVCAPALNAKQPRSHYSNSLSRARPYACTDFHAPPSPSFNTNKMVNEHDMMQALAECDVSEAPNYAVIAKKYNLERSTLSRCHRGKTVSREHYESEHMQCLTNAQERVLIN
jgi:hypothetical protein